MDLKKRSVLFIGPAFFGYETAISGAIKDNGFDVDFFDERTSNNSVYKAVFRVKKSLLNNAINSYYKGIANKTAGKTYDFLLLIKGEVIPEWFIILFQKNNPAAKLIYYTYDSFNNNNKNSQYILKHFNACYSFDFEDVKKYPALKLKHLFYTDEFINNSTADKKYTISFAGTLHSNRYKTIKNLFAGFRDTFLFFYSPARWFFMFEKRTKKDYKEIQLSEVSFSKLSRQQVADIFKSSASVLDIQRHGQTGLTMRTFEVLAAGSILITTNPYIKQTGFYDRQHILVLDNLNAADNIAKVKNMLSTTADKPFDTTGFEKYHVKNWVKEFFE